MRNGEWQNLDNHLEKLLKDIFLSKSLFLAITKDIESLLELLVHYGGWVQVATLCGQFLMQTQQE